MGSPVSIIQKWREEVPWWIAVVVLVAPLTASTLGYCCLGSPEIRTVRSFLGTLATVQGTVLAIVFSVTLVAVQLTAGQYSPRLATLYARSPTFSITFIVFVVSIGFNLLMLFNTPLAGTPLYRAGLYGAGGLLVAAGASLYWFVRRLTYLSTPEGVLDLFEQNLTTDEYLERTRQSLDDDEPHPLRPLHGMAVGALANSEATTAEDAVRKEVELTKDHHRRIIESDRYDVEEIQVERELTKPVLREHLAELVVTGTEREKHSLVRTTIQAQVDLAEYGMAIENGEVVSNAIHTLNLESRRAHSGDTIRTLETIWRQYRTLLEPAVNTGDPEIVRRVARGLGNQLPGHITPTTATPRIHSAVEENLQSLRRRIVTLCEEHGTEISQTDFDWIRGVSDLPASDQSEIMWYLLKSFKEITNALLRYRKRHGEDFSRPEQILLYWEKACESAVIEESGAFASAMCRVMIELVLIYDEGASRLIHIGTEHPERLSAAFDEILAYDPVIPDSEKELLITDYLDDKYYKNQIGPGRPPLNSRDDFPEAVEQLRDEVMEEVNQRVSAES